MQRSRSSQHVVSIVPTSVTVTVTSHSKSDAVHPCKNMVFSPASEKDKNRLAHLHQLLHNKPRGTYPTLLLRKAFPFWYLPRYWYQFPNWKGIPGSESVKENVHDLIAKNYKLHIPSLLSSLCRVQITRGL